MLSSPGRSSLLCPEQYPSPVPRNRCGRTGRPCVATPPGPRSRKAPPGLHCDSARSASRQSARFCDLSAWWKVRWSNTRETTGLVKQAAGPAGVALAVSHNACRKSSSATFSFGYRSRVYQSCASTNQQYLVLIHSLRLCYCDLSLSERDSVVLTARTSAESSLGASGTFACRWHKASVRHRILLNLDSFLIDHVC